MAAKNQTSASFEACETELLSRFRGGDDEAFAVLVRRNYAMIYKTSLRMLRNHEDAEDTLQNVLIKMHQHMEGFEGYAQLSTWIFRITVNEALMMLRRNRHRQRECALQESSSIGNVQRISAGQTQLENAEGKCVIRDLANKALRCLDPELRGTVLLHEWEGWSQREVARILRISPAAVKSRVYRAKRRLRQEMAILTLRACNKNA
jgi:RNA polymerase sigma-70 factor (ECF subfamily)